MRNIKLVLAYDGSAYAGWQRQKGQISIQQTLEEAIGRMTGAPVVLHGAGRTDAGVHADGMVANFSTSASIPEEGIRRGLNSLLPADIRALAASEVAEDFHARYRAIGKTYEYRFVLSETMLPRLRLYAAQVHGSFDCEAVRCCLPVLAGTHDFSSFEATGSRDPEVPGGKGAVRTISAAELIEDGGGLCRLILTGDGFLRHMVRNIVGTLFAAGKGRLDAAGFAEILAARDRSRAGATAPACGLTLKEVFYP